MNTSFIRHFTLASMLFLAACGGTKQETEIIAPEGMHTLNLSKYGKPFAIFVPDTVTNKLHVTEQTNGALEIRVGSIFALSINEQAADIDLRKLDIKEDELNKFKRYLVEEPSALFWESEIVHPEFHFLINQKIGSNDYSFEDIHDTELNAFSKEAVQKMFDSSKNIKEISREKTS